MVTPLNLADFDVTKERGFLPPLNPYRRLPIQFRAWDGTADALPELLAAKKLGTEIYKLPPFNVDKLYGLEHWRAHVVFSFLVHGYIWELHQEDVARTEIPAHVAIPYAAVSRAIGMPPVLSYASYALNNWRLIDNRGPIELGNIALIQNFLGGLDEDWFTLVHIEIEAKAGRGIFGAVRAQEAALEENCRGVENNLHELLDSLELMNKAFSRMPESCDPYIYFSRVRPWIYGWKTRPELRHTSLIPDGVIYKGVQEFGGKPQQFRGETGAQSSFAPLFDAILGVQHAASTLSEHLQEMRDYMPPKHRALIAEAEKRPPVRTFVQKHECLRDVFNACLYELRKFRQTHYGYAESYINKQARKKGQKGNSTSVGTGGTPFMTSLKKHLDETLEAKV